MSPNINDKGKRTSVMEVVQGVFKISGAWDQADLDANVYLLALGGGFTLVDTGYRGKVAEFARKL